MLNGSQTARWLWVHTLVKKETWPLKPLSKYLWSLNGKGITYISVGTRKRAEKVSVPEINYCNCRSVSWMMLHYPASKMRIVVHGPLLSNILRSAVGRRCIGTGAVWAGVQPWGAGCLTAGAGRWVLRWFSVRFSKGLELWLWGSPISRVKCTVTAGAGGESGDTFMSATAGRMFDTLFRFISGW